MACICGTWVHVNSNKFVLEAVILHGLFNLFLFSIRIYFCNCLINFNFFVTWNHIVVTVRFKIKNLWEFEELVYFVISKCVEVEHNSLKMDDQHIRSLGD